MKHLRDAQSGDTIAFDPAVLPSADPVTIFLKAEDDDSALPNVTQGGLVIDASNAGAILDGRDIQDDWVNDLEICSDGNIVRGLQIVNLTGSGIAICSASSNKIGGDQDNNEYGIQLLNGGNTMLEPPRLSDVEIVKGIVKGTACANCTVELFSANGAVRMRRSKGVAWIWVPDEVCIFGEKTSSFVCFQDAKERIGEKRNGIANKRTDDSPLEARKQGCQSGHGERQPSLRGDTGCSG